jgi:hypothetical protein
MTLFTPTTFDELRYQQLYSIHFGKDYYYVGVYQGRYKFPDPTSWTASFSDVQKRFYNNPYHIEKKLLWNMYFSEDCDFKRQVEAQEEAAAYQEAFEKQAVNQIVGNVIGHAGNYY